MTQADRRSDAQERPLPAAADDPHRLDSVHPVPQKQPDDVLPNLLLDVREGFLAAFRPVFRQFGVTDQQFRVLTILHFSGDLEISKLARRCRIVAPSMTGVVNRMAEVGWVTRKASKGQRWGVISISAAGRKLTRRVLPPVDDRVTAFSTALGPERLAKLVDLLLEARTVLRELGLRGTPPPSAGTDPTPGGPRVRPKRPAQPGRTVKRAGRSRPRP